MTPLLFVNVFIAVCNAQCLGGPAIPWAEPPADAELVPDFKSASHRYEYNPTITTTEQIESFNKNPGLYAVLLHQPQEGDVKPTPTPVSFVYLDCSEFLLSHGSQTKRSEIIEGVYLEVTIHVKKPLIPTETAVAYDPLVITFGRLANYPKLELASLNSPEQAFDKVYLYGNFDFGQYSRFIFSRPLYDSHARDFDSSGNPTSLQGDFCLSTCLLPGMQELSVCHQKLLSSTYYVQLHDEDLCKRAFHERNVAEYHRLMQEASPHEAGAAASAAGGKGAKDTKAAAPKKGKEATPDVPPASTPPEAITVIDKFLVTCITNALKASEKVYTYGSARFRLDPLLRSSEDLLLEFQRRHKNEHDKNDTVVLKDSIRVDVRLQKPSKPIKWSMPTDISIKKMLHQSRDEDQSKLNGTLAPILPTNLPMNIRPRYEQFFVNETTLKISAKLLRKLKHPKPEPSVLLSKTATQQPSAVVPKVDTHRRLSSAGAEDPPGSARAAGSPLDRRSPSPAMERRRSSTPNQTARRKSSEQVIASPWPLELQVRLKQTPFTRMVFIFRYDDDATLSRINKAVNKVNSHALPDIQGSIRSYSFTAAEREAAVKAVRDVVTGFTIIDDDVRIVVVEGLAGPGQGMQSIFVDVPRIQEDNKNLKILCNPEVLFPERLYAEFGPDIKR
jgi:hypothetical protein